MGNKQTQITTTVRITFSVAIAPIRLGTEEAGYYNVELSFFSVIRCKIIIIIKTQRKPLEERTFAQAVNNSTSNLTPTNSSYGNVQISNKRDNGVTHSQCSLHYGQLYMKKAGWHLTMIKHYKNYNQVLQLQGVSHSTTNVNSKDSLKMNVNSLGETARTHCPKATGVHIYF